jgi:MFS transporter, Spinster family, sphingosine-1-phosphate transporter
MTARRALIILTAINYLNYIDRLILAAVLGSMKTDLSLSDFQAGLLATGFMIPYMLTSPLFGWLGDTQSRSRIIAVGTGIWSFATFMTGFARQYWTLLATRCALGIGESAFTTISMPFLADFYPANKRGRAFAIFATAAPVGAALGYILGGVLGSVVGWRNAFFIVGLPGLLLAFLVWKMADPRKTSKEEKFDFKKTFNALISSKAYVFAVLGFCANTFVVGGVAHWIPSYIQRTFAYSELQANTLFGALAVGSGLLGTLGGGWLGDYFCKKYGGGNQLLCALAMLLATPCFYIAVATDHFPTFVTFQALTLIFIFMSTSPINIAFIESVSPKIQTTAMAMAILACHVLGDAFSAPIMGYVSDMTGSLKNGLLVGTPFLALSAALWFFGAKARAKEIAYESANALAKRAA